MKHIRLLMLPLLLLALALPLCACGSSGGSQQETPANMQSTLPGAAAAAETETPAAPQETDDPLAETKAAILKLKDHPVSELYDLIGEPDSSDYAPSCLGPGEDGCLYYEGFTVYTYREDGNEVVYDVE